MAETGTRLSPGMKIFLGVDAVLVVTFLVLLVMAIAGGGAEDDVASPADVPASAVGQVQAEPDLDEAAEPVSFTLPSGNIACDMTVDGATCSIASAGFAPTAECTGEDEQVFVVDASGVSSPCAAIPDRSAASAGTELEYGSVEKVGGFTCTSATDGVTCVGESGAGFRLSRSAFVEIP
ncbi:hypothetical protein [Cellulomonas chengniuliangii]|uniref:Uncharacterized protein n=1 Tax=Cellulomonas chengniuliangii TaxID=2968084 RepID=A0ABY5KX40_9CELL|nr:hypothetical protein [Cellulomonas chengniuliangii]MCC2308970.1 hypothetical protein [Cellulomonas chengniuliangii]UUI74295.1 hypothetical protein NP064_10780 [Cellulomonas chengniuliangii]